MHGRYFGGNTVLAYIWDGDEKFKKYNPRRDAEGKMVNPLDAEIEENERLERYGDWLESGENQKTDKDQETANDKTAEEETVGEETNKSQETGTN